MEQNLKDIVITDVTDVMLVNILGGGQERHITRNVYGLSFCNKGKILYEHDGKQFVSDPLHVLILPKDLSYTIYEIEPGQFPVINFTCTDDCKIRDFINFEVDSMSVFMNSYNYLQKLFLFKSEAYHLKALSVFYDMLSKLIIGNSGSKEYQIILPGIKYLEEHFSDPMLSVGKLASVCSISDAYFRKLFKAVYGSSPRKYLIDVRIKKAKQLLNVNRPSIQDVAFECGFSSVFHFCRCFNDLVGCTATEYHKYYGVKGI